VKPCRKASPWSYIHVRRRSMVSSDASLCAIISEHCIRVKPRTNPQARRHSTSQRYLTTLHLSFTVPLTDHRGPDTRPTELIYDVEMCTMTHSRWDWKPTHPFLTRGPPFMGMRLTYVWSSHHTSSGRTYTHLHHSSTASAAIHKLIQSLGQSRPLESDIHPGQLRADSLLLFAPNPNG
jgi:hypothetical protein